MEGVDRPGVVISDGHCGLRLVRDGAADEIGHPTIIEVWAGPFSGTVRETMLGGYACFRDDLARLYDALSGEAKLFGCDGSTLALFGDGLGAITLNVTAASTYDPDIRLTYAVSIDQTYLPAIIRQIAREFALDSE